jgi:hypothetical protein
VLGFRERNAVLNVKSFSREAERRAPDRTQLQMEAANAFLREHYLAEFNRRFQQSAAQAGSAFVPRRSRDLDLIFALQFERTVNRDKTVSFQNLSLQIAAVRWRGTLAGFTVTVHQHLDGSITLTHGPHRRAATLRRAGL